MSFTDLPQLQPYPPDSIDNGTVAGPVSAFRSGVKTSEFWISLVAIVLPAALGTLDGSVHEWARSNGWVGGIVAASYTAARSYIKSSVIRASADVVA